MRRWSLSLFGRAWFERRKMPLYPNLRAHRVSPQVSVANRELLGSLQRTSLCARPSCKLGQWYSLYVRRSIGRLMLDWPASRGVLGPSFYSMARGAKGKQDR